VTRALVVDALAAYRITHLITEDTIPFGRARTFITDRWPGSLAAEWVECPWCAGMAVAVGVTLARALIPRWWTHPATAFACSAITGLLATWEHRD
jgi:hypothetical protein